MHAFQWVIFTYVGRPAQKKICATTTTIQLSCLPGSEWGGGGGLMMMMNRLGHYEPDQNRFQAVLA